MLRECWPAGDRSDGRRRHGARRRVRLDLRTRKSLRWTLLLDGQDIY